MKNFTKILLGMLLIVFGLIIGANALGIADIDLFFDGWWTLFIIIPSLVGLVDGRDRQGSFIGLVIGLVLLLAIRDVISFELVFKLFIPTILVIIGVSMIWNEIFGSKIKEKVENAKEDLDEVAAILKEEFKIIDRNFKGSIVDAIFGHAVLDLRKAEIEEDATIKVSAIFGSVDILLPEKVNAKIKSTKIFGGIEKTTFASDKKKKTQDVYIDAFSMFGGIKIR